MMKEICLLFALYLNSCGVLYCTEESGVEHSFKVKLISTNDINDSTFEFYAASKGRDLFGKDGEIRYNYNPIDLAENNEVIFTVGTKNYTTCSSEPEYYSVGPLTIHISHSTHRDTTLKYSIDQLKDFDKKGGYYIIPDIRLTPK